MGIDMNEKKPTGPVNNKQTIDLLELWEIFWTRKILIILCAFVAVVLAVVKITFFTADVYNANGILYVSNHSNEVAQSENIVYGSDINTARLMTTTYVEILSTRSFLTDVSNIAGGEYSWGQIRRMMSISSLNDTELLRVNVNSDSPESAWKITNAILNQAKYKLGEVFAGGEVTVVEYAVVPAAPNGKNSSRTLMMALLAGIAIGCAIAFLLDYFDTKIRRSDDVAKRYNISILGEIYQ